MKHLCLWLIRFYRKRISPLKKPCCRFTPSCSAYALEAFSKRGFFVGFALTVWRILRCNPYCAGGYDPVPEKGFFYRGSREIPTECCRDSSDTTVSQGEAGEDTSSPEASLHGKDNHL